MSYEMVSLAYLVEDGGLMFDGDWIESKDQDPDGDIRLLQLADIGDGVFINKSNRYINQETALRLKCTFLKKNDILIARMPDPLGRACIFPFEEDGKYITVVDVCVLRIRKGIDPRYVCHGINNSIFRNSIASLITGTTRLRISRKNLSGLRIPLPPHSIQEQIADALDKADALRRNDQLLLQKYNELLQSIFYDLFGDPIKNEKGWKVANLDGVCKKITDGTHDTPQRLTEGIKFITGKHIRPGVIDYENSDYVTEEVHNEIYRRCNPEHGDVLYTNIGVNLATAAINTVDYEFSMKNVALLKPSKDITGRYLEGLLNTPSFKNNIVQTLGGGGAQQFLSLKQIRSLKVLVPDIDLQKRYENIINQINQQRNIIINETSLSNKLFNSLQQRLYS